MSNGRVRIRNASAGTAHVSADIAGFYGPGGSGFTPRNLLRAVDTRSAVGVPTATPIAANGRIEASLGTAVPANATSAVLTVTALNTTRDGQVTFYAPGGAVPTGPDLTFAAGRAVGNTVIAPVVNGKVALAHTGTGTVHIVADLAGYSPPVPEAATYRRGRSASPTRSRRATPRWRPESR